MAAERQVFSRPRQERRDKKFNALRRMGTWGPGLFSDDLAADVRDDYRSQLEKGLDGAAAAERVMEAFASSQTNSDEASTFWLALAATQWRYGRLQDDVKARALQFIEDGSDAARFSENAKLFRERRRVLEKVKAQLTGPQRKEVRVKPRVPVICPWEAGEVITYQGEAGKSAVVHVQSIIHERDIQFSLVSILDIVPESVNAVSEGTPARRLKRWHAGRYEDCFYLLLTNREYKTGRFAKSGLSLPPKKHVTASETLVTYVGSKGFDGFLSTGFD